MFFLPAAVDNSLQFLETQVLPDHQLVEVKSKVRASATLKLGRDDRSEVKWQENSAYWLHLANHLSATHLRINALFQRLAVDFVLVQFPPGIQDNIVVVWKVREGLRVLL